MKGLKVGATYQFGAFNYAFIVIATYKDTAWVEWLDDKKNELVEDKQTDLMNLLG